jgi:hypothetical protein
MSKGFAVAGALSVLLAIVMGSSALAQEYELESSLEGFPEDETFSARMVGDYVVVADDDYCRMLIGATFGPTASYMPEDVLGKNRKAQQASLTRFAAPGDDNTALCAEILRNLGGTVLPESLATLLPSGSEGGPEAPSGEGRAMQGNGAGTTDYFRLDGGLYLAMVDNAGCETWEGMLMHSRGEAALPAAITESNLLEDIEPGLYYWSIQASDCDWSVTILPEQQ